MLWHVENGIVRKCAMRGACDLAPASEHYLRQDEASGAALAGPYRVTAAAVGAEKIDYSDYNRAIDARRGPARSKPLRTIMTANFGRINPTTGAGSDPSDFGVRDFMILESSNGGRTRAVFLNSADNVSDPEQIMGQPIVQIKNGSGTTRDLVIVGYSNADGSTVAGWIPNSKVHYFA